ncbi:MAG TPA: hypothetical protein VGO63_01530 [Candidatus Paceibacterota bacterium]|jgi:hypothetical protein|nr:hypothetical protein [Candidatus Paceibacterota bacterium]
MKEQVYLNRIAVDWESLYARTKDYFHRHGVDIDFEFVQTDYKDLSYEIRQFPQGERIILQPYMANVVPIDPAYDFTSFVFNGRDFVSPNIPTGYTYSPQEKTGQPFLDILTDPLNPEDLDYITICHEHMHALVIKANQKGFNMPDVMDTYYNAMQLESADSNFGQQWVLLDNYIKSLQKSNSKVSVIKKSKVVKSTATSGWVPQKAGKALALKAIIKKTHKKPTVALKVAKTPKNPQKKKKLKN